MIDEKKLTKAMKNRRDFWFSKASKYAEMNDEINTDICDGKGEWIPCSARPPEELMPVNITWTNRLPAGYYAHIKDVHFTYTGIFYKGKQYWWSAYAKDTLAEYGNDEVDEMADEIEVLAWQPLPEPWKGEEK